MALRALCLFDGYRGFELGLRLAGLDIRTVALHLGGNGLVPRVAAEALAALAVRAGIGTVTDQ